MKIQNLKKVNIEFLLSLIFFLLLFYVTIQYTYPILENLNLFSNVISFEIDYTWGRQIDLTKYLVISLLTIFFLILLVLRVRQLKNNS